MAFYVQLHYKSLCKKHTTTVLLKFLLQQTSARNYFQFLFDLVEFTKFRKNSGIFLWYADYIADRQCMYSTSTLSAHWCNKSGFTFDLVGNSTILERK